MAELENPLTLLQPLLILQYHSAQLSKDPLPILLSLSPRDPLPITGNEAPPPHLGLTGFVTYDQLERSKYKGR